MKGPLAILVGYGLGAIPFGLLLARWRRGIDPRRVGSGNIGAANVLRSAGKAAAGLTLILDAGKGAAAVALAGGLDLPVGWVAGAGLAAVAGHLFPVTLGFRGGKGVATSFGVILALRPPLAAVALAVWLAVALASRYASLAALCAAAALPAAALALGEQRRVVALALVLAGLVLWRHQDNIRRLLEGTERRIGESLARPEGGVGDRPARP